MLQQRKYKLVIFDLDGTLLDTLEDLTDSVNVALSVFGYEQRTREEIRGFVGNGIRKLIERAVPKDCDADRIDAVYRCFTDYYKSHCAVKTKPYEGMRNVLEQLRYRGCKTAVVSNKADAAAKFLAEKYFGTSFNLVFGERAGIARKPSPEAVCEVMRMLSAEPEHTAYVGDSEVDAETAKNAGIDAILVDWGFRDREGLLMTNAKEVVSTAEELLQIFR